MGPFFAFYAILSKFFFRYLVRPVLVEDNKSAALFFTGCVISQLVERTSVKTNQ